MLTFDFSGWIQVRLATDPDPFDEPRGISGYVRTLAGEPDFDRIIRLHEPVAPRRYGPSVGVFVRRVVVNGQELAEHALIGAPLNLLDGPKFEGRNGIIAEDVLEPILPFHIEIATKSFVLRRKLGGNYEHPFRALWGSGVGFTPDDWQRIIGTEDPATFLLERRERLIADRIGATDLLEQAQLDQRIEFLKSPSHALRFAWGMKWDYPLMGTAVWTDSDDLFTHSGDIAVPWRARFRIGIWDADTLSAFMEGTLLIPLKPK